ncbi:hypothetical protein GCM10009835_11680 [Planosporangium flavigriseum]|uniref:Uncharacterized protein n=1 Tax=Planosporangium flavigriseum TaxID=373681 RepID=A0A8J3LNW1_9ACTN|nr:hypothetical protein Pfl04_25540 [Planosporangium flavigriseum]
MFWQVDGDGVVVCWARAKAFVAELTLACAVLTSSCAAELSIRASTCPAATESPGFTSTSVTVPPVLKLSPRLCMACTVPAADEVSSTTPRCTRTVAGPAAAGAPPPAYAMAVTAVAPTAAVPSVSHSAGPRPRRCAGSRSVMVGQCGHPGSLLPWA